MYGQRLCLGTSPDFKIPVEEQIALFKKSGFDGFFTEWTRETPVSKYAAIAKELNMIYQSVHAPCWRIAGMWGDDEELARDIADELIDCLKSCAENGIPIMVSHAYIGFDDPDAAPNQKGLERFKRVVDAAENFGVKIAFENTEGEQFLEALINEFGNRECVGYCWDSGHEMCYSPSLDLLNKYGQHLIATHINDNLGVKDFDGKIYWTDDLHLLPFDGIGDWDYNAERLDKCGYNGILTFELKIHSKPDRHENDKYRAIPIESYIAECYARACRFAAKRKISQVK